MRLKNLTNLFTISLCVMLASCFGYRPANKNDWSVGYSEKSLNNDTFLIEYDGHVDTPFSVLREYLLRHASELCPGSFDLTEYRADLHIVTDAESFRSVTGKLHCTAPPINNGDWPGPP